MSNGKYPNAKVYFDGSHYIAIPHEEQSWKKRKDKKSINAQLDKPKEIFEKVYKENSNKKKREKKEIIKTELKEHFKNTKELDAFIQANFDRKKRNTIVRKTRLMRKVNLQEWNYFCTFTYDSEKLNEEDFRKKLSNCLKKLSYRKKWKYIGVWERSPTNNRLHFHCLLYAPQMIGTFENKKDYSTTNHKMQSANQNSYFLERFGRNDFKTINPKELTYAVIYLMKYIEKSGEKIVYSKGLPTYFVSDIIKDDIVCTIGQEDRKILLFDNFTCLSEGEVIGKVSQDTIDKMPKCN